MGRKWDGDATPAEKLLSLFSLLFFNDRAFSLTELSAPDKMNMSKPSVSRMIERLERSGIGNIRREQRGREAYFRMERPARLPAVCLNAEALGQLALCRELLANLLPAAMQREIQSGLGQMAALAPKGSAGLLSGIGAGIAKGRIDYAPFREIIHALTQAIREKKACLVRYRAAGSGEEKEYAFAPKRLLAFHEGLYADGWHVTVTAGGSVEQRFGDATRLAVQRMRSCVLTGHSAASLPDPPMPGGASFGFVEEEPFDAVIRFAPSAADYAAERKWSAGQAMERCEDGSLILRAAMGNEFECLSWVLGFGESAEILEPDWLRKDMKALLGRMRRLYADKAP